MYKIWCRIRRNWRDRWLLLPSNVSWNSRYEVATVIERSTIKYMEELELELSSLPGYVESETIELEKERKIKTD